MILRRGGDAQLDLRGSLGLRFGDRVLADQPFDGHILEIAIINSLLGTSRRGQRRSRFLRRSLERAW